MLPRKGFLCTSTEVQGLGDYWCSVQVVQAIGLAAWVQRFEG